MNPTQPQAFAPARRRFLRTGPALAAALALPIPHAHAQSWTAERWVATWGTAPAGPPPLASTQSFTNQTLRLIVRSSTGGTRVRIRISNEMSSTPLRVGAANIGVRSSGAVVAAGSGRVLTFGGRPSIVIPAGAPALSDPVAMTVPALSDLAVSLYLQGTAQATTIHNMALQTSYVSLAGDFSASPSIPVQRTLSAWPFLTEVAVEAPGHAIVTLGDSITDGVYSSSNANRRWPDFLARRVQAELGASRGIGVVNRGISANRLLLDDTSALLAGRDSLERFERDVAATAGVKYLIPLIGINDICYSNSSNPVSADDLIAGYRQLIMRAHAKGIFVFGATMMPIEGFVYYTGSREAVRQGANNWMRSSAAFDALIDFDQAMRDPARPARLRPAYNSGDHIHPNDLGYQAMANAVPLTLFSALASGGESARAHGDA